MVWKVSHRNQGSRHSSSESWRCPTDDKAETGLKAWSWFWLAVTTLPLVAVLVEGAETTSALVDP
jgi:hypothetical protein